MASSPANATERLLTDIAGNYQAAIAALAQPDLEAVGRHLDQVDDLTGRLSELDQEDNLDPVDPLLVTRIEECHGRLCQLVGAAQSTLGKQLQRASHGRRALRGYGNRASATGNYHRSDA